MDHKQFFSSLRAGAIAPCYVFEGAEEFVKRSALDALRQRLLPEGLADINESRLRDPAADYLIAAAETLPVMADRRLVTVFDCGMLLGKGKGYDEGAGAQALAAYLQNPAPTACIVFYVQGRADGRKKLYAALKKSAVMVQFDPLDEREATRWITQRLGKMSKRITPSTCQRLMFTAGADLTILAGELDKLAAYAGEREEILPSDIDAICIRTTAFRVYDLSGALLRGDAARAFTLCASMLRQGEEPLALLSLLGGECRRMLAIRILRRDALSTDDIARRIGAPPFAVRQLAGVTQSYSAGQLRRMADACMDAEFQAKSGLCPVEGTLEKVMLQLLCIRMEGK